MSLPFSEDHHEQELRSRYASVVNDEQFAVVTAGDGPHLVLAGAGSGKTRVITYRVAWLLDHGVHPSELLLLTFTNKAAKEMIARVESLLGAYPSGLWAGTFHAIGNRLLRMYGDVTGFGANFTILDEEDAEAIVKRCLEPLKKQSFAKRIPAAGLLLSLISFARNARRPLEEILAERLPTHRDLFEHLCAVAEQYAQEKRFARAMDFDDLLLQLLELLQHPQVKASLTRRFRYILVDEFQDTNMVQADIVHALAGECGNILAVGDDAQSIYSFRAAEIQNILTFPDRYPGTVIHRLVKNYRSTPEILAVANAVIARNSEQFSKELVAVGASGELPEVWSAQNDREEATMVADRIAQLLRQGAPPREIAVLFRAAFHAQQVEFELMRRGIVYEYRGGMKFFERAHIKDALAYIRVLRNVYDMPAWIRVLRMQSGIGAVTAQSIAEQALRAGSLQALRVSPPPIRAKAKEGYLRAMEMLERIGSETLPAHMLRLCAKHEAFRGYLDAEYENARDRRDDVEQLARFAEQYEDVGAFLDAVTLTGDFSGLMDTAHEQSVAGGFQEAIILSTIHQAKGLEWDTVFLIHLAEGAFPSERSYENPKEMAEERRLFYVAATRAKKKLVLTYSTTSGYEYVIYRQPSSFLDDIPFSLLERRKSSSMGWGGYDGGGGVVFRSKHARVMQEDPFSDHDSILEQDDTGERKPPVRTSFLRDV